MAYFSVVTSTQDNYVSIVAEYFECQAFGVEPNYTCKPTYDKYNYTPLAATTYVLMGLVTTIILIYVINWRAVANSCLRRLYYNRRRCKTDYSTMDNDSR